MTISCFSFLAPLSGRLIGVAMLLLVSVFLSACETVSQPQGPSYLDQLQLAQVDVDFSGADRPLLVAELDGDISRSLAGGSTLGTIGTRFGVTNRQGKQAALEQAIAANVEPHVRDALTPLFRGARPVRAVVGVRSVFIRSRASLQQLTGAHVFINGEKRPDNAQFIATLSLYDLATGAPINHVGPIKRIDDGGITIAGGGPKAPPYGKAGRLNQLAFEFAQDAADVLKREAAGQSVGIENDQGNVTTLWERRTTSTF
ncbi:MAG: hypothetical protein COA37_02460 [Hoeflea sp.]|uniref:hypothetical protein n=1 Tax=Hoeflea sp. TaxID=1940281 RepID=UPI000C0F0569|nr:hypothetical protein [Hoeflea sp.]PHR25705.1 MAG: hypothetical protein COA37_02460 [Hoeflea sp.]